MITSELERSIVATLKTNERHHAVLKTDQRVIARITEGIYRQPSSALRELISNAYDADATEVTILTDAPRFEKISIRDDGQGMTPAVLADLITHIGASSKKTTHGINLGVTKSDDLGCSKKGRKLIGQMGIGLFSVAQLTRHFQILTKTKGANFRTIADITLNMLTGGEGGEDGEEAFKAGDVEIWTESASDIEAQGTEVLLLELRKSTRDELASRELWERVDAKKRGDDIQVLEPQFHIGRVSNSDRNLLQLHPSLPWKEQDAPELRFKKLVQSVYDQVGTTTSNPSLEIIFDKYLQTLWSLSIAAPLEYVETHPFDLKPDGKMRYFEISNELKGQAKEFELKHGESIRRRFQFTSPDRALGDKFSVHVDGVKLLRPLRFTDLPLTNNAIETPLLFVGKFDPDLSNYDKKLTGGKLQFEAYLLWAPLVVPTQHRGALVRIGDATGMSFDPHFMTYQVSENTRLKQLTAEIFVRDGLEGAINIDRESFNFSHPHYQLVIKWLHGAIKQFTNRQKDIGKRKKAERIEKETDDKSKQIEDAVAESIRELGVEESPEVVLIDESDLSSSVKRKEGKLVFSRKSIFSGETPGGRGARSRKDSKTKLADEKVKAIIKLLHAWGLLNELTYLKQEKLVGDLARVLIDFEDNS